MLSSASLSWFRKQSSNVPLDTRFLSTGTGNNSKKKILKPKQRFYKRGAELTFFCYKRFLCCFYLYSLRQ